MSITFAENNHISENLSKFLFYNLRNLSKEQIVDHFIKIFDSYYLNYILYRKQRDLMIVNTFYQIVLESCTFDSKIKDNLKLTDLFLVKKKKLIIDNSVVPINKNEVIMNLENEMQLLKALKLFFDDIFINDFIQQRKNIEKKIDKVKNLNDSSIINRITHDEKLKDEILNRVSRVKEYSSINANYNFYNILKKELEMINS